MTQKYFYHYASYSHQSIKNICDILVYRMVPLSRTLINDTGKYKDCPMPIHYVIVGHQYLINISSGYYYFSLTDCEWNFNTRENTYTHIIWED